MQVYRKERIDNAILFFAREHYKKTKKYLSQTALYKYLAFFEFRYLKKSGDMPLELTYRAMEHGPVPIEIYENRDNPEYFSLVLFEPSHSQTGTFYRIKPKPRRRFNPDYFAEAELNEMRGLIEIFAQKWVGASTMSRASHDEIKAWKVTRSFGSNPIIDPIAEFDRDISAVPENELHNGELRYLMRRRLAEIALSFYHP
jgi:hypothetical protein